MRRDKEEPERIKARINERNNRAIMNRVMDWRAKMQSEEATARWEHQRVMTELSLNKWAIC